MIVSIPFLGLSFISPVFAIVAALCLLITAYFAYARYKFSPRGGSIQPKIWERLLDQLGWDGKGQALDIGCGNGSLVVALAQRHPQARVTGIDYWGKTWDYSKTVCKRNAEIAGVADRTSFQKASYARQNRHHLWYKVKRRDLILYRHDHRERRCVLPRHQKPLGHREPKPPRA